MVAVAERPETRRIEMMPGGQSGFFFSRARYPALFGGVGACKSFTGLHKTIDFIETYPRARFLATEPTVRMVEDVLIPTLRQEFGSLEGWGWTLHGSPGDRDVLWHNGSVLMLRSALLMTPDMLSGLFLAGFWMDEIALGNQERTYANLQERLRQPGDYPYQGWVTGTPRGKNWCYGQWGPGHKAKFDPYHVRTEDNPYLPAGYYEDLRDSFGDTAFARQELGGEFVAFQGLIYAMFSTAKHVQEPPARGEFERVVAGVDFSGGTSPSVIEVFGRLPSRRVCGIDEFYLPGCSIEKLIEAAAQLQVEHRISRFYCDPSGTEEMAKMASAGLPVAPAPVKDVNLGIKLVSGLYSTGGFTLSARQVYLIGENFTYQWREQRSTGEFLDEPVKANDHAEDATRYALTALVEPPGTRPRMASTRLRV
jgi:hypothetical protein